MCSVVGCDSLRRSAQRFKLPEDPERRLEWVQFLATVNKQRFKESSWTDITICREHFKDDCFVDLTGTVQLKPGSVPTVCPQTEEPEPDQCEVSVDLRPPPSTAASWLSGLLGVCFHPYIQLNILTLHQTQQQHKFTHVQKEKEAPRQKLREAQGEAEKQTGGVTTVNVYIAKEFILLYKEEPH
uniref:THAP domain-containing protein 1 n=1 Tax=Stegastes partitus TaxID=144197 RepID=A0A3B4ZX22_9TELE